MTNYKVFETKYMVSLNKCLFNFIKIHFDDSVLKVNSCIENNNDLLTNIYSFTSTIVLFGIF